METENTQLTDNVELSKILLIEDESAHAMLIKRALTGIASSVVTAANNAEARELLTKEDYELVLCDFYLPDSPGPQLVAHISQCYPLTPVVIMTSSDRIEDAVTAMKNGAYDYMVKHFSDDFPNRLKLTVKRAARHRRTIQHAAKIQAERDAFWVAVSTAWDGLATIDFKGDIIFTNPAFERFLAKAWSDSNLKQANIITIVESMNAQAAIELKDSLLSSSTGEAEIVWRSELIAPAVPPEAQKSYELSIVSVQVESSVEMQHIVWLRDITQRKEQEKFQRDLLATTSHDLKGPLGAILTSAELLNGYSMEEKAAELITRIASCARNCITLIDEHLSARRIQDGVLVVRPRWYKVAEILEDVVLDYLPMAKSRSLELSSSLQDAALEIYADKIALQRVLNNLVSNAIKFTKQGGVRVDAEKRPHEVVITISDTGCGIETDAINQLFERYSRLEKHADIPGTGLGLFVAKNIVAAHNGRIEVRSQLGVGTSFIVAFPDEDTK